MSTPIARSSGALSTNGTVKAGAGVLTFAQSLGGTMKLYDGSTAGTLLVSASTGIPPHINPPVQFSSTAGLYVAFSTAASSGIVHTA